MTCVDGCRGTGGNGCPTGETCTSTDGTPGICVECAVDGDCARALGERRSASWSVPASA
mgnify:CR=1 FL=1